MQFGEDTFEKYLTQLKTFKDGEIIFEEGTAGGWIYVVAYGQVEIFKTVNSKQITLDRVYEGEVLGEVSFFDKRTRSAGAKAVGEAGLLQFDDAFLTCEYEKMPNCYRVILEAMALRLRRSTKKLIRLATNPKIVKWLIKETEKEENPES